MSDEKKSRKPWLTGNLFPRLGLILCQVWIIVAVGALVMVSLSVTTLMSGLRRVVHDPCPKP